MKTWKCAQCKKDFEEVKYVEQRTRGVSPCCHAGFFKNRIPPEPPKYLVEASLGLYKAAKNAVESNGTFDEIYDDLEHAVKRAELG